MMRRLVALAIASLAVLTASPAGATPTPTVYHGIVEGRPTVFIANPHGTDLELIELVSELDGSSARIARSGSIVASRQGTAIPLEMQAPERSGSYAITTRLTYAYEGEIQRLVDVDVVHQGEPNPIEGACSVPGVQFSTHAEVLAQTADPAHFRLAVPADVTVTGRIEAVGQVNHHLQVETRSGLQSRFYYGIVEREQNARPAAGMCTAHLTSGLPSRDLYLRGIVPRTALIGLIALFFGIAVRLGRAADAGDASVRPMVRWASRMALLSLGYWIVKDLDRLFELGAGAVPWASLQAVLEAGALHMRSSVLQPFFSYLLDPYFLGCLLLGYPYFRKAADVGALADDKYVALVRVPDARHSGGFTPSAKLGGQVFLVKLFFVPLVSSFAIGHLLGLPGMIRSTEFEFRAILDVVVRTCFLIDTSVFAFGYIVESRRLGNEIRSVDPHLFGWFVCLACYVPFGPVTFAPFAIGEARAVAAPGWLSDLMALLVVGLWIFYTSASVALGPKAANLSNRGIVERGPYRWVRHPAYVAKLSIWALDCAFFGKAPLFQWVGFALFYTARAWSEERHLRQDPEYEAYRQRVRWWFIPRVL